MQFRIPTPAASLAAFCLVLPATAILSSNAVVPLLLAAALAAVAADWRTARRFPRPDMAIVAVLVLFLAWAAICSIWSFDNQRAIILVFRLTAIFAAGLLLAAVILRLSAEERMRVSRWLVAGFAIGLAIFFIEAAFDFPIRRLSRGIPPTEKVWFSELNRGAIALAMLTWPVTVAALWRRRARWALGLPLVMVLVVGQSESLAALAGLATGCIYAAAVYLRPGMGRVFVLITLVAGFAGAPLIAKQLYVQGPLEWELVPENTRFRIHFWGFIADRVSERPFLGWGFDSSRHMPNLDFPTFKEEEESVIPLHPHNAVLQLWLELGAPGALLGFAVMVILWARIRKLPYYAQVAGYGLLMTTVVAACSAYGLWQNKWMSMMIAAGILMCLYRKDDTRESPAAGAPDAM